MKKKTIKISLNDKVAGYGPLERTMRCDVVDNSMNWLNVRKSMCIIYLMNKIGVSASIQSVLRIARNEVHPILIHQSDQRLN